MIGQETEYAISCSNYYDKAEKPSNKCIFLAFKKSISQNYTICEGDSSSGKYVFFCENGGAFCFESSYQTVGAGLIEGATPECSTPSELVCYQRAQEQILIDALDEAEEILATQGYFVDLRLIKNQRDSEGNIYGTQENYTTLSGTTTQQKIRNYLNYCTIALFTFLTLLSYIIIMPLTIFCMVILVLLLVSTYLFYRLVPKPCKRGFKKYRKFHQSLYDENSDKFEVLANSYLGKSFMHLFSLCYMPWLAMAHACLFTKQRKGIESHLLTRILYTGAGSVAKNNTFSLSEKATIKRKLMPWKLWYAQHPIFEMGHFFKAMQKLTFNHKHLFQRRQRLQLSLSDSNRCEYAEWLRLGTTQILLKMAEQGLLQDAPLFKKPIRTLSEINQDLSLKKRFKTKNNHGEMSALEVQRWYYNKAKEHLKNNTIIHPENQQLLRTWDSTLNNLENNNHQALLGRIDWINKKYLLAQMPENANFAELKKIDTKYHELCTGYFEKLHKLNAFLIHPDQIKNAMSNPPNTESAKLRAEIIKNPEYLGEAKTISWSSAQLKKTKQRSNKIIYFHDFLKKQSP